MAPTLNPLTPLAKLDAWAGFAVARRCPALKAFWEKHSAAWWWGGAVALSCLLLAGIASWYPWGMEHYLWPAYEAKCAHPLQSLAAEFPAGDHRAKLDFRLTVPLFAWTLGLQRHGLVLLYLVCQAAVLFLAHLLFLRSSKDRAAAGLFCLALAATPPGSEALFGRAFFDPAALLLGTACLLTSAAGFLAPLALLLSFVDERALLMFPAIAIHHAFATETGRRPSWRPALVLLVVALLHFGVRIVLARQFGLTFSLHGEEGGFYWLFKNFRFFQAMTAATFEFGWLLVLAAGAFMLAGKMRPQLGLFALALAIPLIPSVLVADVGRSMNYALPAFLALVVRLPAFLDLRELRGLLLLVAALNLLWWDMDFINQPYPAVPAPVEWLRDLVPPAAG